MSYDLEAFNIKWFNVSSSIFVETSQFAMSYQIQNSTKALWAIFCLLPIQKPILQFTKSNTKQYISIYEYFKAGKNLKKGSSVLDIESLLYVMNLLQVDEDYCNELLFGNKMQNILFQFGMVCSIGTVYLQTEDIEDKRKNISKQFVSLKRGTDHLLNKKNRRNQHPLEIR